MSPDEQPATKADILRIEKKLDTHLSMATKNEVAIGWLKLWMSGITVTLGGLFYQK
jgi:hypothetical protein